MTTLALDGVTVQFPFAPYACQREYMRKVIECLEQKTNGVLESPTGTGKTLCLLCSALAWREQLKDKISSKMMERRLGGETSHSTGLASWGSAAADGEAAYYTDIPKIIYASRTHSQLAQVIKELKNTAYRPKICVLGSREQLCINPEVMRQESSHVKVHMCRKKVSTRSCPFYNNTEESSTDRDLTHSILDVEDLVKFGNKKRVCPYYLSRSLKQEADVIFMPYNYLVDPKSRRAHNIELNGAVVIFDEAHNLEKTCEESTSFDLTPYEVASAIAAVDRLLVEQVKATGAGGTLAEDGSLDYDSEILLDLEAAIDSFDVSSEKGLTKPGMFIYELLQRAHLTYQSKAEVYEALEQISGYLAAQPGIFLQSGGIQKLADIIQLVFCGDPSEKDVRSSAAHFKVHIHQDTSHNRKKQTADIWASSSSSSSSKAGNILSYWCFSPGFSMQDLVNQGVRCVILTSGTLSPLDSFTSEMRIDFPVRLENGHVIERDQIFVSVVDRGPDGVQLSSAFDRRFLLHPDMLHLTGSQAQLRSLSLFFCGRFLPENMASLGNTVANLSRVVPHGLLVFFPSFPLMEKVLDFWRVSGDGGSPASWCESSSPLAPQAHGHAERIDALKPIFVEPKGKANFSEASGRAETDSLFSISQVMDGYYNKVNDPQTKGGSFFAVCRGKASEGLDFADAFGRAVVITGLPFPPRMDPRVILKMQFLDEMNASKTSKMKPAVAFRVLVQFLSGQQWYRQQAFRAVNQAVGRVIRHRHDFGAIFLCDHRFKNPEARAQLPSWLKPCVHLCDSFGSVIRDVSKFFRVAQKRGPGPGFHCPSVTSVHLKYHRAEGEQRPAAESCGTVSSLDSGSSGVSSASLPQSSCVHKAMTLDTHFPSLKRKRLSKSEENPLFYSASEPRLLSQMRQCAVFSPSQTKTRRLTACPQSTPPTSADPPRARGDPALCWTLWSEGSAAAERTPVLLQHSSLSTLSLQYDKRMQDELRGGKRKIRLVQEQKTNIPEDVSGESKRSKARTFLGEMKRSLSQVTFERIVAALQSYKRSDSLEVLLPAVAVLAEDASTHSLLRGMCQFVRPHHKKGFDQRCQQLTGRGCGFEPDHSLPKTKNQAAALSTGGEVCVHPRCVSTAAILQLNTQLLNQGGPHLTHKPPAEPAPPTGSVPSGDRHSAFVADVKRSLPPEKSVELFQSIRCYKNTDDYDKLAADVAALFKDHPD
ncbi:unnamed protein product, partial [Tetraodon nigroviridis]